MAEPQPKPPSKSDRAKMDSSDTTVIIFDGPGDTTVRPMRPGIPRGWYPRPNMQPPAPDKPDSEPPKKPEQE